MPRRYELLWVWLHAHRRCLLSGRGPLLPSRKDVRRRWGDLHLKKLAGVLVGITSGFALAVGLPLALGLISVPAWLTLLLTLLCLGAWAFRNSTTKGKM